MKLTAVMCPNSYYSHFCHPFCDKWVPCYHGMVCPQVADGEDSLHIRRLAANILYMGIQGPIFEKFFQFFVNKFAFYDEYSLHFASPNIISAIRV
jgi:hypothetical protein